MSTDQEIRDRFSKWLKRQLDRLGIRLEPRYNIAPTTSVPAFVTNDDGELELRMMRWGLQQPWMRTGFKPPINARSETISEKPMFRGLLAKRRCLIPVSGYYEWRIVGGAKQPYAITTDHGVCMMAGIYNPIHGADGETVDTFAIITVAAPEPMAEIHDRMPAILHPGNERLWLDSSVRADAAVKPLLMPYPTEEMRYWRVGTAVGNVRNDGPELIAAV